MYQRLIRPSKTHSYFIFGARGSGKTTWLKEHFKKIPHVWIDLLNPEEEERFLLRPSELSDIIANLPKKTKWIIIDEIQKAPKLLDLVHLHIEKDKILFALTGSSARKLKRGAANLLAGRAFVYHMHPLTHREWAEKQDVLQILMWGSLPGIFACQTEAAKTAYLRAYAQTYLTQEIIAEQLVRKTVPFRRFLQVAAQSNAKIINYSNIARDIDIDYKNIETYFEILEETHVGFRLYPFQSSFRKRLSQKPKFYFFDLGVTRALSKSLDVPLKPSTSAYGEAFEQMIILEFYRLCSYVSPDTQLSYIQTKDGLEVDLVVEVPGKPLILVEIKSTKFVKEMDVSFLNNISADLPGSKIYCLSQDQHVKKIGVVACLPWQKGIEEILKKTTLKPAPHPAS